MLGRTRSEYEKLYKCPYSSEKNISFFLLPDKLCIHGTKKKKNSYWFSKLILFQQMNTDYEKICIFLWYFPIKCQVYFYRPLILPYIYSVLSNFKAFYKYGNNIYFYCIFEFWSTLYIRHHGHRTTILIDHVLL